MKGLHDRMLGHHKVIDWIRLITLVVLFSTSFILTKIAGGSIPPLIGVSTRLIVGGSLIVVLAYGLGHRLPPILREGKLTRAWTFFFLMGFIGNAAPFLLIFWGQQVIDSSVAAILMAFMPLTTLVLAHFFVADDHMTRSKLAGFIIGFLGLMVLFGPDAAAAFKSQDLSIIRLIAIFTGAILYAINTIIARHSPPMSPILASAGILPAGALLLLPVVLVFEGPTALSFVPSKGTVTAIMTLAIFTTAFATIVYMQIVKSAGPSFMAMSNYIVPIAATGLGIVFGGETPGSNAFAALVIILSGVAISQVRSKKS